MASPRGSPPVGYTPSLPALAVASILLLAMCCSVQATSLRTTMGGAGSEAHTEPRAGVRAVPAVPAVPGWWGKLRASFHASAAFRQLRTFRAKSWVHPSQTGQPGTTYMRGALALLSASPPPLAPSAAADVAPCSIDQVKINVYTASDFAKRLQYPPLQTVYLALQNSITLSQGLIFNASFACTIVNNTNPAYARTLTYASDNMPALTIIGTSNIWFQGVGIKFGIKNTSLACPFGLFSAGKEFSDLTCPGVYVVNSYGIQINQASVYGRMDVFRSTTVILDHLKVTSAPIYRAYPSAYNSYNTHGFIRMGENGVGADLVPSNNVISNCEVYGGWELITLYRGATGVTVANNYLHDFLFAGVRCGADTGSQFDCYMNNITKNLMVNPWWYAKNTTDVNMAGVYTCTHFFNPGNYISCNYIYNTRFCMYLDMASSGMTIDGGVCNGTYATVKVNGGKYNKINSLITVRSQRFLTYYSCITKDFGNCLHTTGNNWEAIRRAYYDTPTVNSVYPELQQYCNNIPTIINGYSCNPPNQTKYNASVTGFCSGFMYANEDESFNFYNQPRHWGDYDNCGLPDVTANTTVFNKMRSYNITTNPGFSFYGAPSSPNDDYGLVASSRIYKINPNFKSCPRFTVGPSKISPGTTLPIYLQYFNIPRPARFSDMLSFPFSQIMNQGLSVPISSLTVKYNSIDIPY